MSRDALEPSETAGVIDRMISAKGRKLVSVYYEDPNFAGGMFDTLGENPANRFTIDDLLAASLLDVRFGPRAVRALVPDGSSVTTAIDRKLELVPTDVHLWEDVELGEQSSAFELWSLLTDIHGIGGTRASKLLARKRPKLFPILDSVIRERLGLGHVDAWGALRRVLADEQLRDRIDALWEGQTPDRPSTLRLLDVMTWMHFSGSANAHDARIGLGLK